MEDIGPRGRVTNSRLDRFAAELNEQLVRICKHLLEPPAELVRGLRRESAGELGNQGDDQLEGLLRLPLKVGQPGDYEWWRARSRELVLSLEEALWPAIELAVGKRFECPDCTGDPQCATCGEPSRIGVGFALFGRWFRWAS